MRWGWAWLPLPVMCAVIAAFWIADTGTCYEAPMLFLLTNFVFNWLVGLCVAFVAGRSFLVNRQAGLLLFGCGALLWAFATLTASLFIDSSSNSTVTIHNLGTFAAAVCHFAGVLPLGRLNRSLAVRGTTGAWVFLAGAYAGALTLLALVVWAVHAGWIPLFFVPGEGGTPLRQSLLALAILLLLAASWLLLVGHRRRPSAFSNFYGLGLALLAVGLAGVWLQPVPGSLVGWAGRSAQWVSGIYLFVAAWANGGWVMSAVPGKWDERMLGWLTPGWFASLRPAQRYGFAFALLAAAMMLQLLLKPWLGDSAPYVIPIGATVCATVLLGFRPGLFCALAGILASELCIVGSSLAEWSTPVGLRMAMGMAVAAILTAVLHAARAAAVRARANEERYRQLFSSMTEGFALHQIVTGPGGRPVDYIFLEVNEAFERLTGLARSGLLGKTVREVLPGVEDYWIQEYGRVALTGEPAHIENFAAALGRWYAAYAYRPRPGQFAVIFSDITARKNAESALARERDLLEAVMNGAGNSQLVYLDCDFNFVRVNEAYAATCGYKPEEMIGKNHFALYPHPENEAIFRRVCETGEPFSCHDKPFEFPDQPQRGVTYWDWTLTPVKDEAGGVTGLVFSLYETTARKKAELRLAQSLEDLRDAQHKLMRGERLATLGQLAGSVAHEIRTPLTVIQNGVSFLEHTLQAGDETLREVTEEMKRAIGTSNQIISEMLEFVREPSLQASDFRIGEAAALALRSVVIPDSVRVRGLSEEMAGLQAHANLDQTTRVLVNLVQNAVQAMPSGGELAISARAVDEGRVQVEVRDTGCGIPPENLEKVFEPLFTTKVRGIGLGLAIAQRYARLNGGELAVESKPGCGSTFRLILKGRA